MWTLTQPFFLILLFVLGPDIYFTLWSKKRGNVVAFPIAVWQGRSFRSKSSYPAVVLYLAQICFWVGASFLIIMLSGPVYITKHKIYLNRGLDILVALDESPTMASRDFKPTNRFQSAIEVIKNFVLSRENDTIGLVTFGKEAALRVPPTLDYAMLLKKLDTLKVAELGDGTSIGLGLASAVLHLENSTSERQVIILLTDGDNNSGDIDPLAAASLAARRGIRIYTVGIGTHGNVFIEYRQPESGKVVKAESTGTFDEKLLENIASTTSAQYFAASSPGILAQILKTIDSLESIEKKIKMGSQIISYHRQFLIAGLALVLAHFFLCKFFLRELI